MFFPVMVFIKKYTKEFDVLFLFYKFIKYAYTEIYSVFFLFFLPGFENHIISFFYVNSKFICF